MQTKLLVTLSIALLLCYGTISAQSITISKKAADLSYVFKEITRQTGFTFFYNTEVLQDARPVTIHVKGAPLVQVLDLCFEGQPITYTIVNTTIIIKRKVGTSEATFTSKIDVKGRLIASAEIPLEGVSVSVKGTAIGTITNPLGEFAFKAIDTGAVLVVSGVTVQTQEVRVNNKKNLNIPVEGKINEMNGVAVTVSTGYQNISKERATGSFVHIPNQLIDRRVSTNILDRLDGITSGLLFNKTNQSDEKFSIRGRSTLLAGTSATPLVVVDNFPYEGNLANINPNDVESITILKDAAAASIWGARSANGVVVITTKKGQLNQKLKVSINANFAVISRPDLFYTGNYITAPGYTEAERFLFDKGFYNANLLNTTSFPAITPAVEILDKKRRGIINSAMADSLINALAVNDVRNDYARYIYRPAVNRQYAASINGGSQTNTYSLSVGLDHNDDNLVRNGFSRITLNNTNTFQPLKNLDISTGITYVNSTTASNNLYPFAGVLTNYTGTAQLYPYARLKGDQGEPLSVVNTYRSSFTDSMQQLGFFDWKLRPLDEIAMADNTSTLQHLLIRSSLRYSFTPALSLGIWYQHESQQRHDRNLRSADSYFVRERINKYAIRSANGAFTWQIPKGAILDLNNVDIKVNNLRLQSAFSKTFKSLHEVSAIAGTEVRERTLNNYARTSYGYNNEYGTAVTNLNYQTALPVNPSGTATIPAPSGSVTGSDNRFVSYYANAAYTYGNRYTVSLSARSDGANIFGVNTNQKMQPLWSAGALWNIAKEKFYRVPWLPLLKLRATIGYNGNTYEGNAFLTAQYSTQFNLIPVLYGTVTSPPNPLLRAEKVRNTNVGFDFALRNQWLSGSIDWYTKKGIDLIEDAPLAPSAGFATFKGNAASLLTKGVDVVLNSHLQFEKMIWNVNTLVTYNTDKVTKFDPRYSASNLASGTGGLIAVEGKPLFGIYSFPWAGIDPANGDPLGMVDGKASNNYVSIISNTKPEDLVFHGSARPNIFGALRNTFSYKSFALSFNITGKFSYYFRKRSVSLNYQEVVAAGGGSADFYKRWQKPGDELLSQVPSLSYPSNTNRSNFYQFSEVLVYRGDHLRLQDIQGSYTFSKIKTKWLPVASIEVYSYLNNLGLIWKKNKVGLDPDYNDRVTGYPDPFSIAFGIRIHP
jgi:TonB-dependent starch-binding outer membrane protein SusC